MNKNKLFLSEKIKYFILGILAYLSIITIFAAPSIGSDGKFGDYFVRITGICLPWQVVTGYENGVSDYATKKCVSLKTLFWNIFGSSIPPIDSSLMGFDFPSGNLIYKDNTWKTNVNGISYTGSQVGISTSAPGSKLDILSGDINTSPLGGGNIIIWASSAGTVRISDMNASYFNGGFVGIGTSTPTTQLEVVGNTKTSTELRTQYIMLGGQPLKIPVVCTGQWKWLHWDGSNWSCIAMPIEWACNNATVNTCTYGTPTGYAAGSCGWSATWTCSGLNGWGSASCSKVNPPCPVNCSYTTTGWWACSVSCGGGTQSSTYHITVPASNGGTCTVSEWQVAATQACNTHACAVPVDGGWSNWSVCSASCGGGTQTRTCTNPSPANGWNNCVGANTQACNTQVCATTWVWSMVNAWCWGEQLWDNPILIWCNASSWCDIASVFGGWSCSNKWSFAFTVSYMGACPASFACQ